MRRRPLRRRGAGGDGWLRPRPKNARQEPKRRTPTSTGAKSLTWSMSAGRWTSSRRPTSSPTARCSTSSARGATTWLRSCSGRSSITGATRPAAIIAAAAAARARSPARRRARARHGKDGGFRPAHIARRQLSEPTNGCPRFPCPVERRAIHGPPAGSGDPFIRRSRRQSYQGRGGSRRRRERGTNGFWSALTIATPISCDALLHRRHQSASRPLTTSRRAATSQRTGELLEPPHPSGDGTIPRSRAAATSRVAVRGGEGGLLASRAALHGTAPGHANL